MSKSPKMSVSLVMPDGSPAPPSGEYNFLNIPGFLEAVGKLVEKELKRSDEEKAKK